MPLVVKRPAAFSDLAEIWRYISDDNPENATRFLQHIDGKLLELARRPGMGRDRSDLLDQLRGFSIGRYVAFYLPHPEGVELVRVLHGARDISDDEFV